MSSNAKRCSSGNPPTTRTTFSRSKTCGLTGAASPKTKSERLQPLPTNTNPPLNDQAIVDEINCLHPAMVNELCLHAKGFSTIPNLSQFSKLQILDLSCNNLTRIDNLRSLPNLRELKLYGNQIEKIENLECLTQLQILQLQYNEISIIGLTLVYLIRLQTLRLDSNRLSLIRPDELIKLTQLKILDLSDCPIENLDFLNNLSSLTEFRACYCSLKTLPNQCRNLRNLVDLDLSNNQLTNITVLKHFTSLRILHLSNNHIREIQILSCLIHLNELDLSFNQIQSIPNTFEKLLDLQYLNISNNQIHSWNNLDALSRMRSLFILNIHENPLLPSIEQLTELCPWLEIIDDIVVKNKDGKINQNQSSQFDGKKEDSHSDEQMGNIDRELKEIDQRLEKSIVAVEAQFDLISNNLQKLMKPEEDFNPTDKKTKHRLFQALTFSEQNYQ